MKIAFLFPGQGSQFVGMGKDFYEKYPLAREQYHFADKVLGFDISGISFNGPEDKLKETCFTQPALYVHSIIINSLMRAKGIKPVAFAGHSLGEYSALTAAGAFNFDAGLHLVKMRCKLMHNAGHFNKGTMAAIIGLAVEKVDEICLRASGKGHVQVANMNSPVQTVISGTMEGVSEAMAIAQAEGAKRVIELNVSGAFHSPLMQPAIESFSAALDQAQIHSTEEPVYANVTADPIRNAMEIKSLLKSQLISPVRWMKSIQNMIADGITEFVEVGAGSVLAGLVKKIDRQAHVFSVGTVAQYESLQL